MAWLTPPTRQPKLFETYGKRRVVIVTRAVKSFDVESYRIARSYYDDEIETGYEFNVWADSTEVTVDEEELKRPYRLHLKVNGQARSQMERGIIGGGIFHESQVEIELNLEPYQTRDVLHELRLSQGKQVIRVDGYSISEKVFRAILFEMGPPV